MVKCGVLLLALAVSPFLTGVHTTPVPPKLYVGDEVGYDVRSVTGTEMGNSLTENMLRTKRGIPNPCPCPCDDESDCEWETTNPCGCDPCDFVKNANEARMLRKQHRKIVTEMKINRLKRKLHAAVCPTCALAHERELEHKPCNKPHVDLTVVLPEPKPYHAEEPILPPHRPTFNKFIESGSQQAFQIEQFNEPTVPNYGEPMLPVSQYEPMGPSYGPMSSEFDPPVRPYQRPPQGFSQMWTRSSAPVGDTEKGESDDEVVRDSKRKRRARDEQSSRPLHVFPENTTPPPVIDSDEAWPFKNATYNEDALHALDPKGEYTTTEALKDSEDARPFTPKNTTYGEVTRHLLAPRKDVTTGATTDKEAAQPFKNGTNWNDETSLSAPPLDVIWQAAYLAATKAVASVVNTSVPVDVRKIPADLPVKLVNICPDSGVECLKTEARQKRDTSSTFASALLTGLMSAILTA